MLVKDVLWPAEHVTSFIRGRTLMNGSWAGSWVRFGSEMESSNFQLPPCLGSPHTIQNYRQSIVLSPVTRTSYTNGYAGHVPMG